MQGALLILLAVVLNPVDLMANGASFCDPYLMEERWSSRWGGHETQEPPGWQRHCGESTKATFFNSPIKFGDDIFVSAMQSVPVEGLTSRSVRTSFLIPEHSYESFHHFAAFPSFNGENFGRAGVAVFKDRLYAQVEECASGCPNLHNETKIDPPLESNTWYRAEAIVENSNGFRVWARLYNLNNELIVEVPIYEKETPYWYGEELRTFVGVMNIGYDGGGAYVSDFETQTFQE